MFSYCSWTRHLCAESSALLPRTSRARSSRSRVRSPTTYLPVPETVPPGSDVNHVARLPGQRTGPVKPVVTLHVSVATQRLGGLENPTLNLFSTTLRVLPLSVFYRGDECRFELHTPSWGAGMRGSRTRPRSERSLFCLTIFVGREAHTTECGH